MTGVSLHPTGDYYVSATEGKSWSFVDIETSKTLSSLADPASGVLAPSLPRATHCPAGLTAVQFHPDGVIFGTGAANRSADSLDLAVCCSEIMSWTDGGRQ